MKSIHLLKGFCLISLIFLSVTAFFLTGCSASLNKNFSEKGSFGQVSDALRPVDTKPKNQLLNPDGMTIEERYLPPKGYERIKVPENSFGEFLRTRELKPYGEKVLYYDGREKNSSGVYDSVFDVDIGDRDLHQCADAIMLLRAEYLYSQGQFDRINFSFVSGFKAEYKKWMAGYRVRVDGNQVSYVQSAAPSNSYESFRKYMDVVFSYSSTLSLEKEMESVPVQDMQIGDVFIVGGSPGHAVIIVDMAENRSGKKIFLLAQSYMPAQQTQLLINPNDENLNPWYSLEDQERLITPEWTFDLDKLKRFKYYSEV